MTDAPASDLPDTVSVVEDGAMPAEEYERIHSVLAPLFEWWISYLGLKWWDVVVCYYDDSLTYYKATDCAGQMVTHAQWEYMHATVSVNAPRCVGFTDDELERMVVHELCHILVSEMHAEDTTNETRRHEERTVSMMTKAFLFVRNQVRREIKNNEARGLVSALTPEEAQTMNEQWYLINKDHADAIRAYLATVDTDEAREALHTLDTGLCTTDEVPSDWKETADEEA